MNWYNPTKVQEHILRIFENAVEKKLIRNGYEEDPNMEFKLYDDWVDDNLL